ncbi:lipase family protein [Mumia qirimensis]|uniref:lipase family protein n=1 Tax=Mumia qirimensis TaxID=3234852 RepID=UPI00351D7C16
MKKLLTSSIAIVAVLAPAAAAAPVQAAGDAPAAPSASASKSVLDVLREAFYHPPKQLVPGPHGSVIWARPLSGDAAFQGARNSLVVYRSRTPEGKQVAVSGTVSVPRGSAPKGGWPVISWLHGTTGTADVCAPSRDSATNPAHDYLQVMHTNLQRWIDRGYAVVATDYQGLGTDGVHSYLIGEAEGRASVDMVRAARRLSPALGRKWLAYGHSQGGHAALFATDVADRWAPELDLVGAVGLAPGSQLSTFVPQIRNLPVENIASFLPLIIRGVETAGVSTDGLLTPRAQALMADADDRCIAQLRDAASWGTLKTNEVFQPGADFSAFDTVMAANEPGTLSPSVPVFLAQGDSDTTVLPGWTKTLASQLSSKGVSLTSTTYAGVDHRGVIDASYADVVPWVDALFGRV